MILCATLVDNVHALNCVCATSNVNIRSGPGTSNSKIGLLTVGSCLPYGGVRQVGGSYYWEQVYFEGGVSTLRAWCVKPGSLLLIVKYLRIPLNANNEC